MWGKNITWSLFHSPFWQTGAVIVGLATFWAKDAGRLQNSLAWLIIFIAFLIFFSVFWLLDYNLEKKQFTFKKFK